MTLTMIHDRLSFAMLMFSAIAAIWGLILYFRRQGVSSNFWGILATAELLILAQGLVGVALWLGGGRPGRSIHVLYGVVAVITLPAFYALSQGRDDRRGTLGYALALLFLFGISLRAIGTGA